eukprot:6342417-Karenia_brevis.AAC.1
MTLRHEAKKAFARLDSSEKVATALLRKAASKTGEYRVGDLISFEREQGTYGNCCKQWSPPARIIRFR